MISSRMSHYIFKRHVPVHLFLAVLGCVWRLFMSGRVWCAPAYGFSLAVVSGGCSLVSASASHRSGFPRGAQALGPVGSGVVAHRLSCSSACEIFPDQGSNMCPLHWQVDS